VGANFHATSLVVGDRGVLIAGPSGSGKTTLAQALIAAASSHGRFARLVGDDQLLLEPRAGRLVAMAPPSIRGLVEVPGAVPHPIGALPRAVIDLVVRLVPAAEMQRYAEPQAEEIGGISLPRLPLAARDVTAAIPVLAARLGLPPFA